MIRFAVVFISAVLFCGGCSEDKKTKLAAFSAMTDMTSGKDNIVVISADYGDFSGSKTCKADLSLCENTSFCAFEVEDGLCTVPEGASDVRNLEVHWKCADTPKARAAAKGTRIELSCP
jgi:hypothetical protein